MNKIRDIRIFSPEQQGFLDLSLSTGLLVMEHQELLILQTTNDFPDPLELLTGLGLFIEKQIPLIIMNDSPIEPIQRLDQLKMGEISAEVNTLSLLPHAHQAQLFKVRVLDKGTIFDTDSIEIYPGKFRVYIITMSDRAYRGVYEDRSGPEVERLSREHFMKAGWKADYQRVIIPDEGIVLEEKLYDALSHRADLIIITGGTGVGPRDITPETVRKMVDKEIPGIMEMIRIKHGAKMPQALLSRAVAGVKGTCLIYAIPGSMGAVKDYMAGIHDTLDHLFFMVRGIDVHTHNP